MLMSTAGKTVWFKSINISGRHKQQGGMRHHREIGTYIKHVFILLGEGLMLFDLIVTVLVIGLLTFLLF